VLRSYASVGGDDSVITRDAFAKMVQELKISAPPPPAKTTSSDQPTPRTDFEAGRMFER
jgi:hypothetical protein